MSVLDTIDTTVSLEFGQSRTIGTLLELSGNAAQLTALQLPDEGGELNVVIDGEEPEESVTLACICVSVSETAWGEQQAEVEVLRVGTTCSASRLRDFIEQYGIARGGSVHIGQNRDNPNSKRFVYHVPDRLDAELQGVMPVGPSVAPRRRETVQFGGDPPAHAPNDPELRKRFKSTAPMGGLVDADLTDPGIAPDDDAGFGPHDPIDMTLPEAEFSVPSPTTVDAQALDFGFSTEPEMTLPDVDPAPVRRPRQATRTAPAAALDTGFEGDAPPTNPDRQLSAALDVVGHGADDSLDAALREALAAVDAPNVPAGDAGAGLPAPGLDSRAVNRAVPGGNSPFSPDFMAPPAPLDDVSSGAPASDPFAGPFDFGPAPSDPFGLPPAEGSAIAALGAGLGLRPPAPLQEPPDDALDEPLDPTSQLDALGADPELARLLGELREDPGPTRIMDAVPDDALPVATPNFAPVSPVAAPPAAHGADTRGGVSPAALMADHDDDDELEDEPLDDGPQLSDEDASRLMSQVDQAIAYERALADSEYYDPNEQIVVNTVVEGVPFADPVRLGNDNKAPSLRNIAPTTASRQVRAAPVAASGGPGPTPSTAHRRMPSDALQKVQSVFAVDFALRVELAVQFQVGRKKHDGTLMRLAESRFRIRSDAPPRLYELIHVWLPPPPGEKRKFSVRCEVTRIRVPEGEGDPTAFDMRVSGGNTPKTMTLMRKLIAGLDGEQQRASA